jgi:hypothetical protein
MVGLRLPEDQRDHRRQQDLEIPASAGTRRVQTVESDLLRQEGLDIVPPGIARIQDRALPRERDLREARETRAHAEDHVVVGPEAFHEAR